MKSYDLTSSEFKNEFMADFLKELSKKFNKTFMWKYFATSHGKGIVDGIGGQAKSLVRTHVMSKLSSALIVQNSTDVANVVKKLMPKTKVILINDEDMPREKCWEEVVPISDVKSIHVMKAVPDKGFFTQENSMSPEVQVGLNEKSGSYNKGDWVVVMYDDKQYPGEITKIVGDEFEVPIMVQAGETNFWKWPLKTDNLLYSFQQIVKNK